MQKQNRITHILILTFLIGLIACTKSHQNNNLNSFTEIQPLFSNPPADYRTIPFFVWNDRMTKDQIDSFMQDFKEVGCGGVFIHPRYGLITEYLSKEWFDLFKYTVEKGKQLGLNVWIYDENSYPSGFAGGHVQQQMPESYNQGQGYMLSKTNELTDDSLKMYDIFLERVGDKFVLIHKDRLGSKKGHIGDYYIFKKLFNEPSKWNGGYPYVDLIYKGVTEKFIQITMTDGYEKYAGEEFGKEIKGTFSDEPNINMTNRVRGIRWTPDLFPLFKLTYKYDLEINLPSLVEEVGDWRKIRHDYYKILLKMFIDRWSKPWHAYCEAKGLKWTGHYWDHEWPSPENVPDNMAMYEYHQVPAVDLLFNNLNEISGEQFGNIRIVKELSSVANQLDKTRTLSETYGGSGWDITFRDLKRNGDWEYVLGVNTMNQHLSLTSLSGERKNDFPQSFSYHEPWWKQYKSLNDYFGRLSLVLSSGKQINKILVIEPTTSAWMYFAGRKSNGLFSEIQYSFRFFINKLEKMQIEYDLGSENIIEGHGSVRHDQFIIGSRSYEKVVIPPSLTNLEKSTFELLKKYVHNGGKVIAFSNPQYVDGKVSRELRELEERWTKVNLVRNEIFRDHSGDNDYFNISVSDTSKGDLYHYRRILQDGQFIFLVNSSLTRDASGIIHVKGKSVTEMNLFSGELTGYEATCVNDNENISFCIPPAGSLMLFVGLHDTIKVAKQKNEVDQIHPEKITVKRDQPNCLVLDYCNLTAKNKKINDIGVYDANDSIYIANGIKEGNPWFSAVQFKKQIVDRDTFSANSGYMAIFEFQVNDKFDYSGFQLVAERPALWKVILNNTLLHADSGKWWLDRSFGVYSIGKYVKQGKNDIRIVCSPMSIYAELAPLYILGDFNLKGTAKGFQIVSPKPMLLGSWKDQGVIFYGQSVSYTGDILINNLNPDESYELKLNQWNGSVAVIEVNEHETGNIAYPPYTLDISKYLQNGNNTIHVKVIGTLANVLGPFHPYVSTLGLVTPWRWLWAKTLPAGDKYYIFDYGMNNPFSIIRKK